MKLTHKEAVNREKDIQDELERLKNKKDKTPEDMAAVQPLLTEFREVHQHRLDLEHDAALSEIRAASGVGVATSTPTDEAARIDGRPNGDIDIVDQKRFGAPELVGKYRDPWDISEMRMGYGDSAASELRARAKGAVERMEFADDKVREVCTRYIERDADELTPVARLVLATTSPAYSKAFIKLVRSRGNTAVLNDEEREAYTRAMGLTDNQGGFMVPMQLDPTIIITANGSFNEVRQIARVVQATGDVWKGISTAGVTGSWDGEGEEVSDDAPTLDQPEIPIHKLQIFVPFSHELQMDAPGLADEISKMIAFEKEVKESIAFVTGSGSGQPTGIITALTGTASVVPSTTTDTFAVGDVHNLDAALPQRYAFNASWLAHRGIYAKMRQFDTNGGASLWGQLAEGRKRELLGRPDYVAEAMDGVINAGQDNIVLAYGDFQNYVVADRLGTTLSYIPQLFGPNGRPVGKAGWHAWIRVGADSVNDSAFRALNVT
ncbi:phage major capsid protein [Mycobacterium hackensackense]|uniref:phage major capsid protein n=1 Tax=Mycobacterium hackensackense TaxID=228909 RepID=UPI00226587F4|nr:phage major capsid protein [Mycobacterium hackensackense]MCV7255333.1 phage major capsid protein [Mycobacterium hackensackense]